MNKFFLLAFLIAALFSINVNAQSVEKLIAEGDELAEKQHKNEAALAKFLQAEKLQPNSWEAIWRISRSYVDIAEHMPDKTSEQKEAQKAKYQLGLDYAEKAVQLAPNKTVVYVRRAIANGRIALFEGVFSVGGTVNKVKKDLEKGIELNNSGDFVQAAAHYVLGRTHAKLAEKSSIVRWPLGLGWGSLDTAIEEYKKAIALRSDYKMFHLDLAKAYIEDDDEDKAKEHLKKLLSFPKSDEDDDKFDAEAKELLKELE